ncbi:hypothetical protein DUI87_08046 [Hirundo rustica rustica]|uniref:Cordon-bleu ubiquitin-like domain-containing protein n=1 Tax=Hirundo rustica rustica TaxID=333673 RepID=A0A3M0KRC3_HIRRU|nr:hypothetical protein DUI87_08046 [Hirundo rustica rustica]
METLVRPGAGKPPTGSHLQACIFRQSSDSPHLKQHFRLVNCPYNDSGPESHKLSRPRSTCKDAAGRMPELLVQLMTMVPNASMSRCMNASMSVSLAVNVGHDDSQVVTISHVFRYGVKASSASSLLGNALALSHGRVLHRKRMKARAPPPPNQPSAASRIHSEHKSPAETAVISDQNLVSVKENMINRLVDFTVILPSGVEQKCTVQGRGITLRNNMQKFQKYKEYYDETLANNVVVRSSQETVESVTPDSKETNIHFSTLGRRVRLVGVHSQARVMLKVLKGSSASQSSQIRLKKHSPLSLLVCHLDVPFVDLLSKAVMDVLVDLCSQYRLNPSQHSLELKSSGTQQVLSYKPNTLIGALDVQTVLLKEKIPEEKAKRPLPRVPEKSVRLVVNYLKTQKAVVRVSPEVPLHNIIPAICEKCEVSQEHIVLLRDGITGEELELSKSLEELGIKELYAWDRKKVPPSKTQSEPSLNYREPNRKASVSSDAIEREKTRLLGLFNADRRNSKSSQLHSQICEDFPKSLTVVGLFVHDQICDAFAME